METLRVQNLSFNYPESDKNVLSDISFSVKEGEFVTLCGLSGSGKSTLLRNLKPSISPHGTRKGGVFLGERDIYSLNQREECEAIGFVSQSPDKQIVTDKVWHELVFGLESLGFDNKTIRLRAAETASFFGIQHYYEKNVSELSGGQKQILNLASVMITRPGLLILDEPTSQLDPIAAADFIACLKRINLEFGTTVILSEHRTEEVFPISDRVLFIENGSLIYDGQPENAGKALKKLGSACFDSLPSSLRIAETVEPEIKTSPLTVAQAKGWLTGYSKSHSLKPLYEENVPECGDTAVSLKNIWFRYEKNSPDVLKNLSLDIHYGEFLTILGGNGAGKSTLLSLINGSKKPYKGKAQSNGALCLSLPQNPQLLFSGKTVRETLLDVFDGALEKAEIQKRINETVSLCELEPLLNRHPFDLSGGEAQKTALAKLLLLKPDVLLLDEPTKGLDARFKKKFARIILSLCKSGTAVVMVSHDIEFCAEYSHRCAMMFNGEIITDAAPREFFSSNAFYATSASRISKGVIPNAVTAGDVIYSCTGNREEEPVFFNYSGSDINISLKKKEKIKLPLWKRILGLTGALLLVFGILENLEKLPFLKPENYPLWLNFSLIALPVIMLMIAFSSFSKSSRVEKRQKGKLNKRTIAAAVSILLLIPLTIYIGTAFLYDQKYLFISLLVLLECMLPFFLVFEGRKPKARELVLIASLCAIAVAGRSVFAFLPQIKPVLALVIISAAALGGETGFMVGAVTMLVSNIYMGQGAWTPWQMFAAGIIGFISGVIFKKGLLIRSRPVLCVYGFIVTVLIYGGIMNFSTAVLSHAPMNFGALTVFYIQGLPYDIIHAFSTSAFLFFLAEPMLEKLERVKVKYDLI